MDTAKSLPNLETIITANAPALRAMYEEIFQRLPPKWARVDYLRGNLAWAIQALNQGYSPHVLRQSSLNIVAKQNGGTSQIAYRPGTRLIREWQGQTYEVTILEKGYLWRGKIYRSLTAISEAITGTRWSGPRFFGLKTGHKHGKE